jgi:hypothetical protein
MFSRGGYVVLEINRSKSNPKAAPHELRRGGDGVLYCECRGWKMSHGGPQTSTPKKCTHTEAYVRRDPSVSYGPMYGEHSAQAMGRIRRAPANDVPVTASVYLDIGWKTKLKDERDAAKKRGVETPPSALAAYAVELDLGD